MTIQSGTDQSTRIPETADYKMLYQQLKMKHQFMLSQVSHEIRNPVTLINSFMQLLEGRHPELMQDNYWQKIMENMDFLKSLLNELSAFNNSEKLNLQNSNIYTTFCEVIESVTPALNERHITIDLQKTSPIPVIKAVGTKLRQLFLNLIRNASDAIETEGHIFCTIQSDGESVTFTISDTGNGIPSEYQDDLFEPFITHKQEGTGLGLPICRRIVCAHKGTISFKSKSGEGTTFKIVLPVS